MQEFLAFIDKVRAQTRASSHSALAMCPVVFPIPSRQARLSTELTPLTNSTRPLSPSLQCVQNNLHIQPGKKRTAKKRSSRSTRSSGQGEVEGAGWVGHTRTYQLPSLRPTLPLPPLPRYGAYVHFLHLRCQLANFMAPFYSAGRAGTGVLGAGTYHLP